MWKKVKYNSQFQRNRSRDCTLYRNVLEPWILWINLKFYVINKIVCVCSLEQNSNQKFFILRDRDLPSILNSYFDHVINFDREKRCGWNFVSSKQIVCCLSHSSILELCSVNIVHPKFHATRTFPGGKVQSLSASQCDLERN